MPRISRKFTVDKKTGKVLELTEPEVARACDAIEAGTNIFKRSIFEDDSLPGKRTGRIAAWPLVSTAAGIDPEDIPAAKDYLAQHGVRTEFTPAGDPVFRDRRHRYEHCKAVGLVDRDGGFGDYTG